MAGQAGGPIRDEDAGDGARPRHAVRDPGTPRRSFADEVKETEEKALKPARAGGGPTSLAKLQDHVEGEVTDLRDLRDRLLTDLAESRGSSSSQLEQIRRDHNAEINKLVEKFDATVRLLTAKLELETKAYRAEYERLREAANAGAIGAAFGEVMVVVGGTLMALASREPAHEAKLTWAGVALGVAGVALGLTFSIGGLLQKGRPAHAQDLHDLSERLSLKENPDTPAPPPPANKPTD